jgi:vancomycin resistance protein YoaR
MTTDSLEPFETKEQSKTSVRPAPARSSARPASNATPLELVDDDIAASKPQRRFGPRVSRPSIPSGTPRDLRFVGLAVAFVAGAMVTFFLLSAVAFAFASSYDNRVLPGVHVGSVDLSGMTRQEAVASLQSNYAYLSQGEVTITTPVGVTTITYRQAGREPDAEVMADAAMSVGHSGNPIADAASVVHSAALGQDIPVVIQVDPTAIAQRIRELVGTSSIAPQDAQATAKDGNFSVTPAVPGHGVDEKAIGAAIVDQLTRVDTPADLQAGGTFVPLSPQVSDQNAEAAIARAQKMKADVILTWKTPPAGAPSAWAPKSWTIGAAQIGQWIVFGTRRDGTYAPVVDPAQVGAYLAGISAKVSIPPVEPTVQWNVDGTKPIGLTPGKNGVGIDLGATTDALSAYLDTLADGGSVPPSLEVVTGPILPQITNVETIANMVVIGQWSTVFYPDISNGYGANIRQPAKVLNGNVVGPGQQFSFLGAVGPIDEAHGFAKGGVIIYGQSDHTGAMGGGICSASTTMFNAAATAGLQIDVRHAHFYYINRYPVGRDATVYSNGTSTWDLKWTNDTSYPIVVRAWSTYGSPSSITFQLWSMPINRTVKWSPTVPEKRQVVPAVTNAPQYVTTLKPGQTYVAEYPDDGFSTQVTRTVTDTNTGMLVRPPDTWVSVYGVVNGQLQIGGTPSGFHTATPSHTPGPSGPTPAPTPTPAVTPPPTPTPTPTTRRRKVA